MVELDERLKPLARLTLWVIVTADPARERPLVHAEGRRQPALVQPQVSLKLTQWPAKANINRLGDRQRSTVRCCHGPDSVCRGNNRNPGASPGSSSQPQPTTISVVGQGWDQKHGHVP